jgi:hypothetical protein
MSSLDLASETPPLPWLSAPALAHQRWRASLALTTGGRDASDRASTTRSYASHTTAIYSSLFGRFCRWMAGHGLNLGQLDARQLTRFVVDELKGRDGHPPSIRTRRMYLGEIERVLAQLASIELRTAEQGNPATELIQSLRMVEPLPSRAIALPPTGFSQELARALQEMSSAEEALPREVRNAACIALMVDCGLTVKELQHLLVRHFRYPGYPGAPANVDAMVGASLHAPGHRLLQARELEPSPWVAGLVARWLRIRRGEFERSKKIEVQRARALSRSARERGDEAAAAEADKAARAAERRDPGTAKLFVDKGKARALQADTLHRATIAVCQDCGAPKGSAGPQALRNEYLANLVRTQTKPLRAAYLAGLADTVQLSEVARVLRGTASPAEAGVRAALAG